MQAIHTSYFLKRCQQYTIRSIQVYCNCDLLIACLNIVTNPCILVNETHVQETPQSAMQQKKIKFVNRAKTPPCE